MFQYGVIAQFDLLVSQFTSWYFNRFKIDLFNFYSFIANISTKWNAQGSEYAADYEYVWIPNMQGFII